MTYYGTFVSPSSQNTKYRQHRQGPWEKAKQTRKFAVAKKIISPKDTRVKENAESQEEEEERKRTPRQTEQAVSALFFQYNTRWDHLPCTHRYQFINFSIRYVIDARCSSSNIKLLHFFANNRRLVVPLIAGKKLDVAIHDGLFAGRNVYRALRTVSWVSLKAG
jgi:hypothetical protein